MSERKTFAVLLACNDAYLDKTSFVAWQLLQQEHTNFDIVICSINDLDQPRLEGVRHRKLQHHVLLNHVPESNRLGHYTYWKLLAIEQLSKEYERILYLDSDILIMEKELSRVFSFNLQGASLAAARDVHQIQRPNRMPPDFKSKNVVAPYFNAGVLLVDSTVWRKRATMDRMVEVAKRDGYNLKTHDQSLLNFVFLQDWLEISPVWNWQYSSKLAPLLPLISPRIIHIAGAVKLWDPPDGLYVKDYWERYEEFAANYDLPKHENALPPPWHATVSQWRSAFLKSYWKLPGISKNLEKFPRDSHGVLHSADK